MATLAPVVLFPYNLPRHSRQTIEALQNNELASESELVIYSDGAITEKDEKSVNDVREFLRGLDGFKSIEIVEREKNWGLTNSIINSVSEVIE